MEHDGCQISIGRKVIYRECPEISCDPAELALFLGPMTMRHGLELDAARAELAHQAVLDERCGLLAIFRPARAHPVADHPQE